MSAVYRTSPVKRYRRTNAELAALDDAIMAAAGAEPPCTVRAVFYRCVSAGAVEKTERGYDAVQRQVLKLRRSGRMPYWWITDGTRWVFKPKTWRDAAAAMDALGSSYRKMLWLDQDVNVEVFSEKDALVGVVDEVCDRWDVPLGVARGYGSESFVWNVAESLDPDRRTYIYQLGDHDPSGVDAWDDFCHKVRAFAP